MISLKPKMFEESSQSHSSGKLRVQLLSFFALFFVILLAESIPPMIFSFKPMTEQLSEGGYLDGSNQLSVNESMEIATDIMTSSKAMLVSLFGTLFGTLLSIFYCRFIEMRSIASMGVRKRNLVPHYLKGMLIGIAMMTAITMLTVIFGVNDIKLCKNINFGMIGLLLLGFFVQGMSEEFIFRGCLMNSLGGKHSPYLAIGINSFGFALAHLANPGLSVLALINLTLFGVFASVYMIRYDDIWGVCAIHSIWNFSQGCIFGISVSGSENTESLLRTSTSSSADFLTGGKFGIEGSIFTTIVLLAGTAAVLFIGTKTGEQSPVNSEQTE